MIEQLIKKLILPSLEFLDLEQCIDCIKGKYVKKIKKDDKRSAGNFRNNSHRHLWSISCEKCGWL